MRASRHGAWQPIAHDGELDLQAILQLVQRRKRWVIAGTLACLLIAIAITLRTERLYEATAKVLVERSAPKVLADVREVYDLGTSGFWANIQDYYGTQLALIEGPGVAERVVSALAIEGQLLAAALQAESTQGEESFGDPLYGLSDGLKAKLTLVRLNKQESRAAILAALNKFDATKFIRSRVSADILPESNIIEVSVTHPVPEHAARIVNEVAIAYRSLNLDRKIDVTRSAAGWLSSRLDELKERLEQSEKKLQAFKKEHNLVSVSAEDEQTLAIQQLTELTTSLSQAQSQRVLWESKYDLVKKVRDGTLEHAALSDVVGNTLIRHLKIRLSELREKETDLASRYTDAHVKLQTLRAKIAQLQAELATEREKVFANIEQSYREALYREQRTLHLINEVKAKAHAQDDGVKGYAALKRERDENLAQYKRMLHRQKETNLSGMQTVNNVSIHELAAIPKSPIKPSVRFNLALGLVLGLLLGLTAAFVLDYLDNTVKSQHDLEDSLESPFLGIIPKLPGESPQIGEHDLYVLNHPQSPLAECCRTIRTNVLFMSPDAPAHTVLVTSAGPFEGKSSMAINLAITMAQSGARTLLVDTDMRRPRLHKTFGIKGEAGISSVVVGTHALEEAIVGGPVDGLDIFPCGPIPPNPAELIHTEAFRTLVERLADSYDRVIFDSPPVGAVTDAGILSSLVDGVVFILREGETTWPAAYQAIRKLRDIGGRIYGTVLNGVDLEKGGRGYHHYYYYRSGYDDTEAQESYKKRVA